jgi:hypothetical protein
MSQNIYNLDDGNKLDFGIGGPEHQTGGDDDDRGEERDGERDEGEEPAHRHADAFGPLHELDWLGAT